MSARAAIKKMRVFFVFAVVGALLIYSSGLWAPLWLDDASVLQIANKFGWQTRPLGFASFWLNEQILPLATSILPWHEPFYFRFGNVIIHAVAATALFWLAMELTRQWLVSTIAGALFLAHPVQTQAVTYISQRFESQAAMFMLFAAAAYARFRRTNRKGWLAAVLLFGAAAAMTKETAVVLPVWLLFMEFVFFDRQRIRKSAVYILPVGLVLLYPAWRAFQNAGSTTLSSIPWGQYLLTDGPILNKYFALATWPRRQFLFYDSQPVSAVAAGVILQWLVVLAVVAAGIYLIRRDRLIGFGIVSFFILLLPILVLPLPDLIFEHRLYPAFAGVALAAAGLFGRFRRFSRGSAIAAVAVFGLLIVVLGIRTSRRNADWNDPIAFLESEHAAFPRDPQIASRLAAYYFNGGRVNDALAMNLESRRYEDRLSTYYRQQGHLLTAVNLSFIYLAKRDLDAAKREALRAVAAKPDEPYAWRVLAQVQLERAEMDQAEKSFRKLAELELDAGSWRQLLQVAARMSDTSLAELAAVSFKEAAGEATELPPEFTTAIPSKYRTYGIFGLTLGLLSAVIFAIWTVGSAVRSFMKSPAKLDESTTLGSQKM